MKKKAGEGTMLEEIFDSVEDSVYVIDDEMKYVFANREHLERLSEDGKIPDPEEDYVLDKGLGDIHSEKEMEDLIEIFERVLEDRESVQKEYSFRSKEKWSLRTYNPLDSDRVVVFSKDITERKRAEKKTELLHSLIRHDVKNKIQISNGYHELLKEEIGDMEFSEEVREYVERAQEALCEAEDVINKVRTMHEAEGEEIRQRSLEYILRASFDRALMDNWDVEYRVQDEEIYAGEFLEEAFHNIIQNSVKHSGGERIRVSTEDMGDELLVSLEDDGRGIPCDEREKIFEEGYRNGENGGTGLGMYLVDNIVSAYSGRVEVGDSELGGARIEVYLKKAEKD